MGAQIRVSKVPRRVAFPVKHGWPLWRGLQPSPGFQGIASALLWSKCMEKLLIWPCVLDRARQMLGWPEDCMYAALPHKSGEHKWTAGQL